MAKLDVTDPPSTLTSPAPAPAPTGPARVAGGLLGVLAGDSLRVGPATSPADAPDGGASAANALVALSRSYIDQSTPPVALTAARFGDSATPAWLLPVAVVCPNAASAAEETYRLSAWARVPGPGIPACVAYVKLAALLLSAVPAEEAIEAATGRAPRRNARFPEPRGQRETDTLALSVWALMDPNGMATAMALTPPWACAAAAGLVGICRGLDAMPASWHHHLAATGVCLDLAYGLLRSRANGATEAN